MTSNIPGRPDLKDVPKGRAAALKKGSRRYFGSLCNKRHDYLDGFSLRFTQSGNCVTCVRDKNSRRKNDAEAIPGRSPRLIDDIAYRREVENSCKEVWGL